MQNQVRFYNVQGLPEKGVLGGIYFVSGQENNGIWIYNGTFTPYTPSDYIIQSPVSEEINDQVSIVEDTLNINEDISIVKNNILKISPVFATVEGDKLVLNYE